MKILRKVLWILATINLISYFTVLFDHGKGEWDAFDYLLHFSDTYFLSVAPFISLIGAILTTVLIIRGLKESNNPLKSECLLLGAFALIAIPFSYMLGLSIMWF